MTPWNAFLEWMSYARQDETVMKLYRGDVAWETIPVDEPLLLKEIIIETTEELTEILVTKGMETTE